MSISNPEYPQQCSYLSVEQKQFKTHKQKLTMRFTAFKCKLPLSESCINQKHGFCKGVTDRIRTTELAVV